LFCGGQPRLAQVKGDWDAWKCTFVAGEPIDTLILDDPWCACSLIDKRRSHFSSRWQSARRQKVLLAVKNIGRKTEAAWRAFPSKPSIKHLEVRRAIADDKFRRLPSPFNEIVGI
jgi:hypothetical protein